jgi:succinate dehydrogenase/fumarate reductase cytochrome b subunit
MLILRLAVFFIYLAAGLHVLNGLRKLPDRWCPETTLVGLSSVTIVVSAYVVWLSPVFNK